MGKEKKKEKNKGESIHPSTVSCKPSSSRLHGRLLPENEAEGTFRTEVSQRIIAEPWFPARCLSSGF